MAPIDAPENSLLSRLKFLTIAGVGFFADGYLNLSVGLVVPMLGYVYFKDLDNHIPTTNGDVIKGSLSLGMIKVYGYELMATMFGTLMCVLLPWNGLSQNSIVAWMSVWRVVTGLGIGGDYPMSSSLAAESTPLGSRAILVLSVFACIGVGAFTSSIVYLILLAAFQSSIEHDINNLEWVWRLLMGLGLVPCALTLYARLAMKETKPFEKYVLKKSLESTERESRSLGQQFHDIRVYFYEWRHAKALFSVCAVWFLFDIAYYGINLNQAVILSRIGYSTAPTPFETLWNTAVGNIIMQSAGYLPGFFIGIFLPDLIGRKRQQFYCSVLVAIMYAIWAGLTGRTRTGGLMAIFTISQLILNSGPNVTTFLLPAEIFPTRVRGTAHGIAAATGKAGAVLTAFAFGTVTDAIGVAGVLGLFSGLMALCAALTLLIPEPKGSTLHDVETDVLYGAEPVSHDSSEEQSAETTLSKMDRA